MVRPRIILCSMLYTQRLKKPKTSNYPVQAYPLATRTNQILVRQELQLSDTRRGFELHNDFLRIQTPSARPTREDK